MVLINRHNALAGIILLVLIIALGCRAPEPPAPVPNPPPVSLVRAAIIVDGNEYVIVPPGSSPTEVPYKDGVLVLEFSGPVDLCSVPEGTYTAVDIEATKIKSTLPRFNDSFHIHSSLRDKFGRPVKNHESLWWPKTSYVVNRSASVPAYITQATLASLPEVEVPEWSPITVMWYEPIIIKFSGDITKEREFITNDFSTNLRNCPHSLEWVADDTLLLSFDPPTSLVSLSIPYADPLRWTLVLVPPQRIIVTDSQGKLLSSTDIPTGVVGALGMTTDYSQARLTKAECNNYASRYDIAVSEHLFDLASSKFTQHDSTIYRSLTPISGARLEWGRRTEEEAQRLGFTVPIARGLSHDEKMLAVYDYLKSVVIINDLETGHKTSIPVASNITPFNDDKDPLYWSPDGSRVLYNGQMIGEKRGFYCLDLNTEEEAYLAPEHYIISASPYSNYVFAGFDSALEYNYYLFDYTGAGPRLNTDGEHVSLAKWLDADRALINKSSHHFWHGHVFPDSKCYIYYIKDGRLEYVADGLGFDYDNKTDRVFILQVQE